MTQKDRDDFLKYCQVFLNEKIQLYQNDLDGLNSSYYTETKSSAGDKYETEFANLCRDRPRLRLTACFPESHNDVRFTKSPNEAPPASPN